MRRSEAWILARQAASIIGAARFTRRISVTELLLFGSLAHRTRGEVGDVDLLILCPDNHSLLNCTSYYKDNDVSDSPLPSQDWPVYYSCEGQNRQGTTLQRLLSSRLQCDSETNRAIHTLVFPTVFLTDQLMRDAIAVRQSDPYFLRNCFAAIYRYDWRQRGFVPANRSYFEHRYDTYLADLF